MSRRPAFSAILSVLLIALASLIAAPSASAHNNAYPWGNCDQRTKLFNSDIRVATNPSFPLPPDGYGGGVKNSFSDRLIDAINEWEGAVRSPYGGGVTRSIRYQGQTTNTDVLISSGDRNLGTSYATTFVRGDCIGVHPTNGRRAIGPAAGRPFIEISLSLRDDWFSQGAS